MVDKLLNLVLHNRYLFELYRDAALILIWFVSLICYNVKPYNKNMFKYIHFEKEFLGRFYVSNG